MSDGRVILIIEDNAKNLKLVRDILQFKGYTTLEAESGEAGIALARQMRPALILMDVQLPRMDGRAAMKALKADASTREIPIIALTAYAMKGDRDGSRRERPASRRAARTGDVHHRGARQDPRRR